MAPTSHRLWRALAAAALAVCGLATAGHARADSYALIMWIGDYGGDPRNNLPGIDKDAETAARIASEMGVPRGNIFALGNADFTKAKVISTFAALSQRIAKDDKVFIYYSGHGMQLPSPDGKGCVEGMVTRDPSLYEDHRLQAALTELGSKASQVIMMNDSCFSGGAATKSLDATQLADGARPKFFTGPLPASATVGEDHVCGTFVNKVTRNLTAMPRGPQVLYIAASAANEVSLATNVGSLATVAWGACLASPEADTDRSGVVDGDELRACAQRFIDSRNFRQTITLVGNTKLPMSFAGPAPAGSAAAPVNPLRTLENIRALRDPEHAVELRAARPTMRIGQDMLDFSVTTNRDGYLYVVHVGSDGKTFDLLFPNQQDKNNRITAGTMRLPRQSWQVRATGPAGQSYLMAVVSPVAKDFAKDMDVSSLFATAPAATKQARNLVAEAAGGRGARLGVSDVVAIRETN